MTERRVLHTSDWHLGQTFHGFDRTWEHAQFLAWIVDTIAAREVDALLVSGDVFDTTNPSIAAQRQWFELLAGVLRVRPTCDVVAIAGNHDSAQRLDAPEALTRALGLRIVGSARGDAGAFDPARLVVPLGERSPGGVWGHVAAIPFLRGEDLGTLTQLQEPDAAATLTRTRFAAVFDELARRAAPGQARLAMAHGVVLGETSASRSERDVRIGNVEGVPMSLFPEDLAYVALGHLHRPQRAGGRDAAQYAGSPLPLHVSEADYPHRAVLVTLRDGALVRREDLPIEKRVAVVRVPPGGAGTYDAVLAALRALPSHAHLPPEQQPFLAVRFVKDAPRAGFLPEIGAAIADKGYRLTTVEAESSSPAPVAEPPARLEDLTPEEVFVARYRRQFAGAEPPGPLRDAFRALLRSVEEKLAQGGAP